MVTLHLFGAFRDAAEGNKELTIPAESAKEVIRVLITRYEKMNSLLVRETDPLKLGNVLITVNSRSISALGGLGTKLKEKDRVSIFSPIGGG
ncbi:MAG: MoaD/ThiS family protein [Euryarchaeota archaeon]|nr:MoaD/ThiS family protein [Euryarchaeota archaeon]